MRFNVKTYGALLAVATTGALTSCTNELSDPGFGTGTPSNLVKLAQTPDMYAYSGGQNISLPMMRTNAGNGDLPNQAVWNKAGAESLVNITDDERRAVLAAIDEKTTGKRISEDVVFPWTEYFLQDVISGQNGNFTGAGSNGTSSTSYTFEVYNKGKVCDPDGQYSDWNKHSYFQGWNNATNSNNINPDYEEEHSNYEQVTNSGHLNNFYLKGASQERINETTLMTDMSVGTYEEMKGKQFRWYINCHENLHWSEYIIVKVDGSYYICFDFGCGHPENDVDENPGRGAEHNDWDYNDWILKITPGLNQPDVWGETHTGDGEIPSVPTDPEDEQPGNIGDLVSRMKAHVEVNLSIEERDETDYLASHLSIHVRDTVDVRVFIPLPIDYYCAADDMEIVQKHENGLLIHGGPERVEYNIAGNTVTLTVEFGEDGITVTTDGINAEVLKYLRENYGDGLTFEVWNYMNITKDDWNHGIEEGNLGATIGIDVEELRGYLNKSTVEFLDDEAGQKLPDLYVNAFMPDPNDSSTVFVDDCTVTIVTSQSGEYEDGKQDIWFNGSPYNELFYKKGE